MDVQRTAWTSATDATEKVAVTPDRSETLADVDVGQTPSSVVYEENKLELLHYEPLTDEQHDVPILIVYALINRPYILDLQPDRSVVRTLLEAGFDVYLIDWGEPSPLDRSLTLSDYVDRYIDNCVDVVRERSGLESISLLGYCMGGTMSAMYAARFPEKVRNLGLMAAGLCFDGDGGVLELWGHEEYYDPEAVTDAFGNVPAEFLDIGFALMDPVANNVTKYARLYDNLEDEEFVENFARMERWLSEGIDVAGRTYEQFIRDVYQENNLVENDLELNGSSVDLDRIDMPVLQIVAEYDHLIPPEASTPFNDAIASEDTSIMQFKTGHIGMSVSSRSHAELWPDVCDWFETRSTVQTVEADETSERDTRTEIVTESDTKRESEAGVETDTEAETETETDTETESEPETGPGDDLTELDGVGPTYSAQLYSVGIETFADLADADAADIASKTGISPGYIEDWIDQAADMK